MLTKDDIMTHHPMYGSKRYGDLTEKEREAYDSINSISMDNRAIGYTAGLPPAPGKNNICLGRIDLLMKYKSRNPEN